MPKVSEVGIFRAREIKELVIAIPADGPSFLEEPDGKCMWISYSSRNLLSKKVDNIYLANVYAISIDSCITFPSEPVNFKVAFF